MHAWLYYNNAYVIVAIFKVAHVGLSWVAAGICYCQCSPNGSYRNGVCRALWAVATPFYLITMRHTLSQWSANVLLPLHVSPVCRSTQDQQLKSQGGLSHLIIVSKWAPQQTTINLRGFVGLTSFWNFLDNLWNKKLGQDLYPVFLKLAKSKNGSKSTFENIK